MWLLFRNKIKIWYHLFKKNTWRFISLVYNCFNYVLHLKTQLVNLDLRTTNHINDDDIFKYNTHQLEISKHYVNGILIFSNIVSHKCYYDIFPNIKLLERYIHMEFNIILYLQRNTIHKNFAALNTQRSTFFYRDTIICMKNLTCLKTIRMII